MTTSDTKDEEISRISFTPIEIPKTNMKRLKYYYDTVYKEDDLVILSVPKHCFLSHKRAFTPNYVDEINTNHDIVPNGMYTLPVKER